MQLYMVEIDRIIIIRQWPILRLRHTSSVTTFRENETFLNKPESASYATGSRSYRNLSHPTTTFIRANVSVFDGPSLSKSRSVFVRNTWRRPSLILLFPIHLVRFRCFQSRFNTTIWCNIKLFWSFC